MKKIILMCLLTVFCFIPAHAQTPPSRITPDNLDQLQELRRIGQGALRDVIYSPNGDQIAIVTTIGVWIYDVNNLNTPLRLFENRTQPIAWADYNPDGTRLLTIPAYVNEDGVAQVWDVTTGALIHDLGGHQYGLRGGAFSPDGKTIYTVPMNDDIWAWDAHTGEWIGVQVRGVDEKITLNMVISPTGQTIAASDDAVLFIWDASTGVLQHTLTTPSAIYQVIYHPHNEQLLTAHDDGHVRMWDSLTGEMLMEVIVSDKSVNAIAYAPSGEMWVSAGRDNHIYLWDAHHQLIRTIPAHDNTIIAVNFSPDGRSLISASTDNTVKLWDIPTGALSYTINGYADSFEMARYNGDGSRIAVSLRDDNAFILFDAQTGTALRTFRGHRTRISSLAYHPTQERIVTSGGDNTIRMWDADTGAMLAVLRGHTGAVTDVTYSSDGEHIISASADGTVWIWDADTGAPYRYIFVEEDAPVYRATLSPDEQYMSVIVHIASQQPFLWVLSLVTETPRVVDSFSLMYNATFHPHLPLALSAYGYNGIYIMQMNPDETVSVVYDSHERYLSDTAFSPDGRVIAYAGAYGRVYVLPFETPIETIQLVGHTLTATSVQFSPDGQYLLTASHDGTLRIWGIPK